MIERKNLAQQLAETLRDDIINEKYIAGDALPTEPELSQLYEVSRTVVRDAVRILLAWGLINVQHGKGMFVTKNQAKGFADALLIALRRAKASVWDVIEFEQHIFPSLAALAAKNHDKSKSQILRRLLENYLSEIEKDSPIDLTLELGHKLIQELISSSGNKVAQILAGPIVRLRNYQEWEDENPMDAKEIARIERQVFEPIVEAICNKDPEAAIEAGHWANNLPPVAIEAMKSTPVGEVPTIPLGLSIMDKKSDKR